MFVENCIKNIHIQSVKKLAAWLFADTKKFKTIFDLKMTRITKEKRALKKHQSTKEVKISDIKIIFFIKTASSAVKTRARSLNFISRLRKILNVNFSPPGSKTK